MRAWMNTRLMRDEYDVLLGVSELLVQVLVNENVFRTQLLECLQASELEKIGGADKRRRVVQMPGRLHCLVDPCYQTVVPLLLQLAIAANPECGENEAQRQQDKTKKGSSDRRRQHPPIERARCHERGIHELAF